MVDIRQPVTAEGSVEQAFEAATQAAEPVWVPLSIYADDRGWSLMNLLQGVMSKDGQINYSVVYPGVIKAWHRHQKQTDFWLCVSGHLKVGVYCEERGLLWRVVMGEKHMGILIIPPTLWHGACTVGGSPAGLMYYVTHPFNPGQPDEQRRAYDSVEEMNWEIQHR